jgi:DNA invertase Pin-like site-specific DNA recombinase
MMLAVIGGVADVERDLIRTCTAEGRSRAKARGQHMRRPSGTSQAQQKRPPSDARRALRSTNRGYAVGTGQVFRQRQP